MNEALMMETTQTQLPEELVVEILSWLPVQSLCNFKPVCKAWRNLVVNDPHFTKLHLLNQSVAGVAGNHQRCIVYWSRDTSSSTSFYKIKLPLMDYDQSRKAPLQLQTELFDVSALPGRTILVGTCNGLLCFECDHEGRVILMNPSTRRFKLSPREDFVGYDDMVMYGFGYDDSGAIDDYKVVRIERVSSKYSVSITASMYDVKVYSMSTNSWTSVDNTIPYGVRLTGPSAGIFFNGAIHWMTSKSSRWHGIIPYDVKDQEFRRVLLAPYDDGNRDIWWMTSFWIIMRECLGVIRVYGEVDYEVWVMKEYGRRESWTKQFVLRSPGMNRVYCSVIGNDQILFIDSPRADNTANIGLYDTKTDETDIDSKAIHSPIGCAATTYIESLVSLKSRLKKKKKRKSATTYIKSFVSFKSKLAENPCVARGTKFIAFSFVAIKLISMDYATK